jgi:hypothetical protein
MKVMSPLLVVLLAGCYASAERYTDKPMKRFDKSTEYCVEDADDGFTLFVYHKRYQMFGNDSLLSASGMEAAETIAQKEANARSKFIQDLDAKPVKANTGRDAAGNSSWSAVIRVLYKKT